MAEEVPSDDAVDRMLHDLSKGERLQPSDVKRHANRLRSYIEALRDPSIEDLIRDLAETPMTIETPGVADDAAADEIIALCRGYLYG